MTTREYFILNRHFHKIFWLQLSSSNHVRHHGIHYYYTIRIWQERISHNKQRNVGRRGWPDFAQKPIDKRKSENVGWFVIIQAQDKSLIYNRSKFIYFNVASTKRSIPHALIHVCRLITRYQEFMSLLFFVF